MKIHQITDSRNQHIVAIEKGGELRCYLKHSSLHTAGAALSSLRRDIANHGETVVEFNTLGRTIYDVREGPEQPGDDAMSAPPPSPREPDDPTMAPGCG